MILSYIQQYKAGVKFLIFGIIFVEKESQMCYNIMDNEIMIYEDKDGITKVNVKFIEDDIWLTQNQISDIYKTTQEIYQCI